MTTFNAEPNARRLARLAGVPCPSLEEKSGWSFFVWADGPYGGKNEPAPRWGHIDLIQNRVTEFNPVTCRHEVIFQQ